MSVAGRAHLGCEEARPQGQRDPDREPAGDGDERERWQRPGSGPNHARGAGQRLETFEKPAQRLLRPMLVGNDAGEFDAILAAVLRGDWSHRLDGLKDAVFTSLAPVEAGDWRGQAKPLTRLGRAD